MNRLPKSIIFAVGAGILGIFLATVGFFRTLLIVLLIGMGFFIGHYLENRRDRDSEK